MSIIENEVTSYEYDEEGHISEVQLGNSVTSNYEYDNYDRLIRYTKADGSVVEYHYSGTSKNPDIVTEDGIATYYQYDASGNVTQVSADAINSRLPEILLSQNYYGNDGSKLSQSIGQT